MLVLSRKQSQEILVGDNVKITVLKVKGNTVRLGIEAPRDIRVVRGELKPEPTVANITVVFDNDHAADEENVQLVPFDNFKGPRKQASKQEDRQSRTAEEPTTVRFRQQLPAQFSRNRLQEIVNELTMPNG